MCDMVDMLFISRTKDEDIINIDLDKNSEFILEGSIHGILKRRRCVLITLLHDSSSVYPKGCLECSVLLVLRNNAEVMISITKISLRVELSIDNCIDNVRLIRDIW